MEGKTVEWECLSVVTLCEPHRHIPMKNTAPLNSNTSEPLPLKTNTKQVLKYIGLNNQVEIHSLTFKISLYCCKKEIREWKVHVGSAFYSSEFYYYFWTISKLFKPTHQVSSMIQHMVCTPLWAKWVPSKLRIIWQTTTTTTTGRQTNISHKSTFNQ